MQKEMWCLMLQLSMSMWRDSMDVTVYAEDVWREKKLLCDKKVWDEVTELAANSGLNSVLIDLGNAVRYKSHPEIAIEGAWEPEYLKEELKRLRKMGLEPYPKLNFSSSHDAWLGQYGRMLSTDIYYNVCRDLIHEVIDLFDNPEFFHLGMDEENIMVQTDLEFACARQHGLIWRDLDFLTGCVREKGVRPWIWADYYWSHPETFLERVEKDVLVSPWHYRTFYAITGWPLPTDEASKMYIASFKELADNGYDVVSCGSNYYAFYNVDHVVRYARDNVVPEHNKGILIAPWLPITDRYKYALLDVVWLLKYAKEAHR